MAESDCTCKVVAPVHWSGIGNDGLSKYTVYIDEWEDRTVIDSACPFHGKHGSMVARWPTLTREASDGD